MFRSKRKLLVRGLVIGLEKGPFAADAAYLETHLRDVAPGRKFYRRPDSAVKVYTVVAEVITSAKLVPLRDAETKGNVRLAFGVGDHVPGGIGGEGAPNHPFLT